MNFAMSNLQEKYGEQNNPLYTVFIDLTKAVDTISREGLWKHLRKTVCQEKEMIITMILTFNEDMVDRVR